MLVMRSLGSAVALATLLIAGPAFAGHPLGTEDPGTADPLTLQMEVTGETHHFADGSEIGLGLQLTTGIVPRLDLNLGYTRIDKTAEGDKPNVYSVSLAGINYTFGGVPPEEKREK
jgi:hypothetical protein